MIHTAAVSAILWLLIATTMAFAAPLRGDRTACNHLGQVVVTFGELRDAGAPWEVAEPYVAEVLTTARSNPESYVQTDADARFVAESIHKLWWAGSVSSIEIAAEVFRACMNKKGQVSL